MLKIKQTADVIVEANKAAIVNSAQITAGNIINGRVVKTLKPMLPIMVRGYADTDLGEFVLANAIAAAIFHTMPGNKNAVRAADCMIQAASLKFLGSFNIEAKLDELLSGVNLDFPAVDAE